MQWLSVGCDWSGWGSRPKDCRAPDTNDLVFCDFCVCVFSVDFRETLIPTGSWLRLFSVDFRETLIPTGPGLRLFSVDFRATLIPTGSWLRLFSVDFRATLIPMASG